jgi:hypothetical protein
MLMGYRHLAPFANMDIMPLQGMERCVWAYLASLLRSLDFQGNVNVRLAFMGMLSIILMEPLVSRAVRAVLLDSGQSLATNFAPGLHVLLRSMPDLPDNAHARLAMLA